MKLRIIVILFLLFSVPAFGNQLKNHASPYLALHGDDPVDWMEWNSETLEKAQSENKPIFISIGYFSCHWCHVMQRESFSDTMVADELNKNYISIKVDRELNPVLDKRLIDFVQATIGRAGWPLNVILTPDVYPLTGATYLPKEHFQGALVRLATMWEDDPERMLADSRSLDEQLAERRKSSDERGFKKNIAENRNRFIEQTMQQADSMQGGFGQQNKFPSVTQLKALMEINRTVQREDINEFLLLTLDQMQNNGLNDAISGGFFRYTVDPGWETPHFEKMLYTNAMLPELYLDASLQFSRPDYKQTAIQTIEFLRNFMRAKEGAYISSLSAVDDKNVEGGFYLFEQEELESILNVNELPLANKALGLDRPAVLEDGVLPISFASAQKLASELELPVASIEKKLTAIKQKLLLWRSENRKVPPDDKLLSGWNGMVLSAFARVYDVHPDSRDAGEQLSEFLQSLYKDDILYRSSQKELEGTLGDYASVALGLLRWAQVSGDKDALANGESMVVAAWSRFFEDGGWLESDGSLLPGEYRRLHIGDSSLTSPETQLLEATLLLDSSQEFDKLKAKTKQILEQSTHGLELNPYVYASLIALSVR